MTSTDQLLEAGAPALTEIADRLAAVRRRRAAVDAEEVRLLAAAQDVALAQLGAPSLDDAPRDLPLRSAAAALAVVCRVSDRSVQARMNAAWVLRDDFPATLEALGAGRIDRAHASVIADAGAQLPDSATRDRYEAIVLPVAERETANRLRPVAQVAAQRVHPVPLDERHRAANARRRVWKSADIDGMGEFGMYGPMAVVEAVYARATALGLTVVEARRGTAQDACAGDARGDALEGLEGETPSVEEADTRTLDAIRFDVVADLLLTGHATTAASETSTPVGEAVRAHVQLTIPVLTLLGHSDEPATLSGSGPIALETAKRLAAGAPGWDRILTHPVTGCVLAVDRYRPSAEQRRLLLVRDEHCRFPGCRQAATRCDVDHTVAAAHDGSTDVRNLAHLCRRHHTLKHHSAWRVRQRGGGVLEWTSPTGHVVSDVPARTLVFTAASDPPGAAPPQPPPF